VWGALSCGLQDLGLNRVAKALGLIECGKIPDPTVKYTNPQASGARQASPKMAICVPADAPGCGYVGYRTPTQQVSHHDGGVQGANSWHEVQMLG